MRFEHLSLACGFSSYVASDCQVSWHRCLKLRGKRRAGRGQSQFFYPGVGEAKLNTLVLLPFL